MKVVAFNGSARKDGNTAMMLNMVLDELKKEGVDTELVQLDGKNIRGCIACFQCFIQVIMNLGTRATWSCFPHGPIVIFFSKSKNNNKQL